MRRKKIVGFTGTQKGMTKAQLTTLAHLFSKMRPTELHHGNCIGADAQAHNIFIQARCGSLAVHPPVDWRKTAGLLGHYNYPPRNYLQRNHDIVDACQLLIAAPRSYKEELRSGTWATVRYARKKKIPVVIIWPDGLVDR